MQHQEIEFKLYLITNRKLFASTAAFFEAVEESLAAGVRAVQLREKDLQTRALLDMAYKFRELTAHYEARLFINDRLDIALSVEADGIHLGQSSIPVKEIRRVAGRGLAIGYSTHSIKEARDAEAEGADFITFGPLFRTPSKLHYGEPLGPGSLRAVKKEVGLPILGIGGIKPDHIEDVLNAGASGVAVISGVLSVSDRVSAVNEYLTKVGERHDKD